MGNFQPISRRISGMVRDRAKVTIDRQQEIAFVFSNGIGWAWTAVPHSTAQIVRLSELNAKT